MKNTFANILQAIAWILLAIFLVVSIVAISQNHSRKSKNDRAYEKAVLTAQLDTEQLKNAINIEIINQLSQATTKTVSIDFKEIIKKYDQEKLNAKQQLSQ